jgi:hypothetical protein
MAIKFGSILPKFSLKRGKSKGSQELLSTSDEFSPRPTTAANIFPSPPEPTPKKHHRTNSFTKPVTTLSNYITRSLSFKGMKKSKYGFKLDSPDFTSKANLPTYAEAFIGDDDDETSFLSEQETRDYSLPSPLFNRPMSL